MWQTILLATGAIIILMGLSSLVEMYRATRVPRLSTPQLKDLFRDRKKLVYYHQAALELKRRGEDIRFIVPALIDGALLYGPPGWVGQGCLKHHFPELVQGMDLSSPRLSASDRARLKQIRESWSFRAES